jgi:hypothetical protein
LPRIALSDFLSLYLNPKGEIELPFSSVPPLLNARAAFPESISAEKMFLIEVRRRFAG